VFDRSCELTLGLSSPPRRPMPTTYPWSTNRSRALALIVYTDRFVCGRCLEVGIHQDGDTSLAALPRRLSWPISNYFFNLSGEPALRPLVLAVACLIVTLTHEHLYQQILDPSVDDF